MGVVKSRFRNMSLRSAFAITMITTLIVVLIISIITVIAASMFQKWLLPQDEYLLMNFNIVHTSGSSSMFDDKLKTGDEMFYFNFDGSDLKVYHHSDGNIESVSSFSSGETNTDKIDTIESMTISAKHIVSGFDLLSGKRKVAYVISSVLMVTLPLIYSFFGVLLCARWFYKRKLSPPIQLLECATEHIEIEILILI